MSFKRISLFGLLLTVSFLNAQLRIVADLAGSHDADSYVKVSSGGYSEDESDSFSADTDIGITVGYDLMLSDAMGVGVEYQMNRGASDGAEKLGKFGFKIKSIKRCHSCFTGKFI